LIAQFSCWTVEEKKIGPIKHNFCPKNENEYVQRSIILSIELFLCVAQAVEVGRRKKKFFFQQFFSTCEKITQFLSFGKYQGGPS
jgi:hypothetical protein